ncbi:DNA polymerase III subunit chi [Pokkaliibacter sp. CJK22405]|uniref:DNA polymerase III subunit chi n=1 Tax=Pokkaliibacter sp. CJK22405 TaxID=3384615 RepID=UPI0039854454
MPSRVDFYILNSSRDQDRWSLLATLLTRQWPKGHRFHIHCSSKAECQSLDQFLWQHDILSFLPHHALEADSSHLPQPDSPITLGHEHAFPAEGDILVNFSPTLPDWIDTFERVLEIVVQDPHWLDIQRQHYRVFKEKGLTPNIHRMG